MVANLLWASGTNGYLSSAQTALSTELNSLASTSYAVSSSGIDNSAGDKAIIADWEFLAGGTFTPTSGAHLRVWLLRSVDGGTNYEDGSASVVPGRTPDFVIPVRVGTTITPRAGRGGIILPPGHFKTLVYNGTGAALPASGNTIKFRTYAEAI
jgi:hypothetical protein